LTNLMKPPKHILISKSINYIGSSHVTVHTGIEINECSNFGFHHGEGTIMKLKDTIAI